MFRTQEYSEHDPYSESCHTSTLACFVKKHLHWPVLWKNIYVGMFCGKTSTLACFMKKTSTLACVVKIVNGCNYFRNINFSRSLLYEINIVNFFNTDLTFTPEVFISCKKIWDSRGPGAVNVLPVSKLISRKTSSGNENIYYV